ncbi:MAG: hypothetical protein HRT45_06925 [Bdellovibrionales bacterium]|nr:hypothetical protein [Bdellovibrionales bacterium]
MKSVRVLHAVAGSILALGLWLQPAQGFELQGLEIEAGTEAPLMVGARMKVQLPSSLHLRAGLGFVPDFYAQTYGDLSGALGIHGENTGSALSQAMSGSLVFDVRAAYSLDPDGGFYAEAGYMYFAGGSGSVTGDVAEDALENEYSGIDSSDDIELEGTFHAVTFHLGYMFLLTERISLNVDVGLVKPIFGSITMSASSASSSDEADLAEDFEPYLEDAIVAEMAIPTASLFLSYLF